MFKVRIGEIVSYKNVSAHFRFKNVAGLMATKVGNLCGLTSFVLGNLLSRNKLERNRCKNALAVICEGVKDLDKYVWILTVTLRGR